MESILTRREMAVMHNVFDRDLKKAWENEAYVDVSWLCYATIEQRVARMLQKHLSGCPVHSKRKGVPASINTRIKCVKHLIRAQYGGFALLDVKVFDRLLTWIDKRNKLTHGLVSLDHYCWYKDEFQVLAKQGYALIKPLYKQTKILRDWEHKNPDFEQPFPFKCDLKNQCVKAIEEEE
ncbi:MAG: hypothetical protein ACOYJY_00560 [Acutalibacteraceae bacterium]